MKVLHVIVIDDIGGAEKLLLDLLPALGKQGVVTDCLILYRKRKDKAALAIGKNLEKAGIAVHYAGFGHILNKSLAGEVHSIIVTGKYELLHSHLKYSDFLLVKLKRSHRLSIPLVTTVHGYRDSYHGKYALRFHRSVYFSLYFWVTRFIFKHVNGFVFISKGVQDFYRKAGMINKKKCQVIYNGYDVTSLPKTALENKTTIQPNIAIPGRLVKFKGHTYAIDAMQKILKSLPNAQLHIYGVGPEEEPLKELCKANGLRDRVIFYGFVTDISEQLRQADIAVIPSIGEPFGLVFLDCFAAGLPVVAFDLPAGNEIVQHEYNGLLAKPLDSEDLAKKIIELCQSAEKRKKIVENAYKKLTEEYNVDLMAAKYVEFYKTFL